MLARAACAVVTIASCGTSSSSEPKPSTAPIDARAPDAVPPPDAAPRRWSARAEIDPIKGSKAETAFFGFMQFEGERPTLMTSSPVKGLSSGKYHLVIHEGRDCGEDAKEAGAAWPGSFDFEITRKPGGTSFELHDVDATLDGPHSVIGHTLVLHADAKGKVGKVLGCGAIFSSTTAAP